MRYMRMQQAKPKRVISALVRSERRESPYVCWDVGCPFCALRTNSTHPRATTHADLTPDRRPPTATLPTADMVKGGCAGARYGGARRGTGRARRLRDSRPRLGA